MSVGRTAFQLPCSGEIGNSIHRCTKRFTVQMYSAALVASGVPLATTRPLVRCAVRASMISVSERNEKKNETKQYFWLKRKRNQNFIYYFVLEWNRNIFEQFSVQGKSQQSETTDVGQRQNLRVSEAVIVRAIACRALHQSKPAARCSSRLAS